MVILSTASRNQAFASIKLAELHGLKHVKEHCCILSEDGKVLAFKRKEHDQFTRLDPGSYCE